MFQNYLKLKEYVKYGWVDENKHPVHPIYIYNYSRKAQFEGKWDEITSVCRGLVLDDKGEIIAQCFPKFWNYEEQKTEIPNESYIIQNKADGSLGIVFWYEGWNIATRGSFNSIQAQKGAELLKKYRTDKFMKHYTYLVEIIYPENRIVLDYGKEEKLVFLSCINIKRDKELTWDKTNYHFNQIGLSLGEIVYTQQCFSNWKDENYKLLRNNYKENQEGYIIKFEPSGIRVKIKFPEYVRLHRIITEITTYDIWESLKEGDDIIKILINTPDEFDSWVKLKIKEITQQYNYIEEECKQSFSLLKEHDLQDRKDQAEWIRKQVIKRYQGIVFRMLDNGNYSADIWKYCKPKYEKPFLNNG